jgi:D-alanyl-lipoteichoic acid acyltransferase DltB (MBOAT superfamily)
MLFNSFQFFVFFPIVTLAYFVLPHRYRWVWLLAASCYFYMAFVPVYILILFFTIAVDYAAGILIETAEGRKKQLLLAASILGNIGVLAFFKYSNFFQANLAAMAAALDWNYPLQLLNIVLPLGLSFHTFRSLSYTIEVYRGNLHAERHAGLFALYVMFYPELVAGPIERPQNLLPQLRERHEFDYERVTDGLKLMAWGFFKKLVIADRLADFVNPIYNQPAGYPGVALALATILFAYQIYCDFSGYSDIATGAAQVMGFRLMRNFQRPYFAGSIADFWRRWHISLSTWFRDYLYVPLGGNRVARWRWQLNLFVTFLVSGLWHGANWTFVAWGALHGLYLLLSIWTTGTRASISRVLGLDRSPNLLRFVQVGVTFSLVTFAWIFFRASSIQDAFLIIQRIFSSSGYSSTIRETLLSYLNMSKVGIVSVIFLSIAELVQAKASVRVVLRRQPAWLRWAAYYVLVMSILLWGKFSDQRFIYFQF